MRRPPIAPVAWTPPPAPARAARTRSAPPMPPLSRIDLAGASGPEDVAVEADGSVVTGVGDGRILRLRPDGSPPETVATTGGRPLGVEIAGDGRLIVCDADRGLLRITPDGAETEVLVAADDGATREHTVGLCNNSAVAPDGTVYFSDSSRRFPLRHFLGDVYEGSGTGRLLRRALDGEVSVLLDGLHFANGVALADDGSFVAVAETTAYRVRRIRLTGPRAGESELLAENLPGMPDNLSTGTGGRIWMALPAPRSRVLDWALPRAPVLRKVAWHLPEPMRPALGRTAWVMALDAEGRTVADLQGPGDAFAMVTGVREHDGGLYLGSLTEPAIARLPLPAAAG
ncbi:SMP-30/gluconolactonase/LRE family protein [Nocardiopsis sediminis]|uniref:SMP-30/gluconolactonase/LRE family protein n=1 Tax=Nocardiopsis sediminis TaxID=1778267 RepID=A0ABV8FNL2_9ACTN